MFKRTRQDDFYVKPNCNMLSEKSQILTNEAETLGSSLSIKDEHFKIYEYNLLNQQVLIATKNGITKYTYNASGLRATKTTENKTVKFYYEGSKIIGEETNGTLTATYLYGQGLINRKDQEANEKHYYFFNVHGDVIALTDETGEVVTVYDYNAYGEFNQRGKDIDNPFTYFGQYYDKETGHYYLRARYYNPSTMRFTQEDTYTGQSNDPLSLNRYLYGLGNPVMFVDPSGFRARNYQREYIGNRDVPDGYYKREITRQGMVYTVPYSPELKAQAEKASITGATLIMGDVYDAQLILIGYDFEEGRWATKGERAFYLSVAIIPGSAKLIKNGGDAVTNKFFKEAIEGTGNLVNVADDVLVNGAKHLDDNPLANIKYTDKVVEQMKQGDFHGFPDIVDNYGSNGIVESLKGGDDIVRTRISVPGNYKEKSGVFEYIIEPDGVTCNHRFFKVDY